MAQLAKITIRVDETRPAQSVTFNPVGRAGALNLSLPVTRVTLATKVSAATAGSWWAAVLRSIADELDT